MTTRTDIMDLTGTPRALEDLTGEEVRALRALAGAGLIAPLDAATSAASAATSAASTANAVTANAVRPARSQRDRPARGAGQATQDTLIAA